VKHARPNPVRTITVEVVDLVEVAVVDTEVAEDDAMTAEAVVAEDDVTIVDKITKSS
jgi:hypothetical protein